MYMTLQQRNLKQKFAALLRRFRVPEELSERGTTRDQHHAQHDIDELFQVCHIIIQNKNLVFST